MAIVQVGALTLQWSSAKIIEGLLAQIEEQVRQLVLRCIEEALEAEVDTLLQRGWYERRRPKRRRRSRGRCKQCR